MEMVRAIWNGQDRERIIDRACNDWLEDKVNYRRGTLIEDTHTHG